LDLITNTCDEMLIYSSKFHCCNSIYTTVLLFLSTVHGC